jgi:hypothetical protein
VVRAIRNFIFQKKDPPMPPPCRLVAFLRAASHPPPQTLEQVFGDLEELFHQVLSLHRPTLASYLSPSARALPDLPFAMMSAREFVIFENLSSFPAAASSSRV